MICICVGRGVREGVILGTGDLLGVPTGLVGADSLVKVACAGWNSDWVSASGAVGSPYVAST